MSSKAKYIFIKFCKWFFGIIGVFSFIILLLSFTDIPFYAYYYLGESAAGLTGKPDVIVVLGGSGMPSPDGLIRTYYGAQAAKQFNETKIIIALPYNEHDSLHQLELMAHEMIIKGIDSSRISFEPLGFNTHSQAENIAGMFGTGRSNICILIITSPEHMYRTVRTFRKAGLKIAGGIPAFEKPIDAEMAKDKENTKDIRVKNLALRYNMWSYLNYELIVTREYFAICYYKIKGWI